MTERSRGIAVASAHRAVRILADGEGPFPGGLVTRSDGVAVRVDAVLLHGWAGWAYAGAEHVAAPLDIVLRPDGQDVLLPWCVRTVAAQLLQEAEPISHGEAITLAVSVLRGVLELARDGHHEAEGQAETVSPDAELRGAWWLTDEARPVFAIGVPDALGVHGTPGESGAQVLRELAGRVEDRALRRLLTRLADALQDPRRLRAEAARWESELLEIAAPRPLRLAADGLAVPGTGEDLIRTRTSQRGADLPLRRRDLRAVRDPGRPRRGTRRQRAGAPRPTWAATPHLQRAVERVRESAEGVWPRRRRVASGRRDRDRHPAREASGRRQRWAGPALVAASAAAIIAVAGALWPGDAGSADAADRVPASRPPTTAQAGAQGNGPGPDPRPSPAVTDPSRPAPTVSQRPRVPGSSSLQDPLAAGAELVSFALDCQITPTPSCAEVWDGGAAAARPLRPGDGPSALIEDYGDIAAIRNGAVVDAQMVVIIRRDAEWRIRDVYDIADPPSEGETPEQPQAPS